MGRLDQVNTAVNLAKTAVDLIAAALDARRKHRDDEEQRRKKLAETVKEAPR